MALQDTYLSGGTRHLSFYLLLKEHMKNIVKKSEAQVTLLCAVEIIFESQQRSLSNGTDVPANIRKRFKEKFRLVGAEDPCIGWVLAKGVRPVYSPADI